MDCSVQHVQFLVISIFMLQSQIVYSLMTEIATLEVEACCYMECASNRILTGAQLEFEFSHLVYDLLEFLGRRT